MQRALTHRKEASLAATTISKLKISVILLLFLVACGPTTEPTPATPSAPTVTPEPTATPAPTPTPPPISLEDYAAAVCDPVDLPAGATWGQLRDKLKRDISRSEKVVPPPAVSDWHFALTASMRETLEATEEFDQNTPMNPYELVDNEAWMLKATLSEQATAALSEDVREILLSAGCNVGDE